MDVRTGYFVSFRGEGYGAYESKTEARQKAIELITGDGNGYSAGIYEGIVFITGFQLMRGSEISKIDEVTIYDCAAQRRDVLQ